ncbi:MAG: flagellar type III secretion system protein FliQ [Planctomycetes bacterium]|nr:flagellar type III secretion system protein FliQ [Planctomycetota bacterium]
MQPQDAIDLARNAIWISLIVSAPVLVVGVLMGLLMGLLQALTQVQEQTVAFVPKLIAMAAVFAITLPWVLEHLIEYVQSSYSQLPGMGY